MWWQSTRNNLDANAEQVQGEWGSLELNGYIFFDLLVVNTQILF